MQAVRPLIRPADARDASAVAALLGELGYPASAAAVAARLTGLHGPDDAVLVAEIDGAVVGTIGMHVFPLLHDDGRRGRITALVVAGGYRGHGIGRQLLRAAEAFAGERGAQRVEVVSGDHRPGAHAFYGREGYLPTAQRRFEHVLDPYGDVDGGARDCSYM